MIAAMTIKHALIGAGFVVFAVISVALLFNIGGFAEKAAAQGAESKPRMSRLDEERQFTPETLLGARLLGGGMLLFSLAVIALILTGNFGD